MKTLFFHFFSRFYLDVLSKLDFHLKDLDVTAEVKIYSRIREINANLFCVVCQVRESSVHLFVTRDTIVLFYYIGICEIRSVKYEI